MVDRYVYPGLDGSVRLEPLGEVPPDSAVQDSVLRRQLLMEAPPGAAVSVGEYAARQTGAESLATPFERLGGGDGLRSLVDRFYHLIDLKPALCCELCTRPISHFARQTALVPE